MTCLILMRHAKAMPAAADDHDRALAPRGLREAAWAGTVIATAGWSPQLALVSDARRTRETFAGVAAHLRTPPTPVFEPGLYEASADEIIQLLARTESTTDCLLLVGHNPGVAETAWRLARGGDSGGRARLAEGFPPAAMAVIRLPGTGWSAVAGGGTLEALLTPP